MKMKVLTLLAVMAVFAIANTTPIEMSARCSSGETDITPSTSFTFAFAVIVGTDIQVPPEYENINWKGALNELLEKMGSTEIYDDIKIPNIYGGALVDAGAALSDVALGIGSMEKVIPLAEQEEEI